jgi:GT2 family glycosyltransferase
VLLLNNDVELDERCVEELVHAMHADPRAAAAQAKLLDFEQRALLDGAGDSYSWAGLPHRRGQGERDEGQYDELTDVFGVCAAAAIYRASALARVGLFDEQLFAYLEDTDWSFRARLAGYRCRFVPAARVYHMGSASLGPRVSRFTLYQNWRNQIWVVAKDYPARSLARHAPDLAMGVLATLYVARRHRCVRVWLRAWRDALAGLPAVLRKRRDVQRTARATAPQLEGVIERASSKLRWWLLGSGRLTAPAAGARSQVAARAEARPSAANRR